LTRALLFVWTILIACPIRYWAIDGSIDNTWVFAINYGAAHGLAMGRDLIWTTGPLGYLVFPQDIGNNLIHGVLFQSAVWAVLFAILFDLFFRAGLPIRNLVYFAVFFSLSAPLYWFNFMGVENLLLAGVLVLLVLARQRGGLGRYVAALLLGGVIPLIKLTAGMVVSGAVFGFLIDVVLRKRSGAWREIVLAASVPIMVTATVLACLLPSAAALATYVKSSHDLVKGYSTAMSLSGDPFDFAAMTEVLIGIGVFLFMKNGSQRRTAGFLAALLAIPLLLSAKHGFVRQDSHVINFFGFAALALSVMSLALPLSGKRSMVAFLVAVSSGVISVEYMIARMDFVQAISQATGLRGASMAFNTFRFERLRESLRARTDYPAQVRVEPEMRSVIGHSPVAFLSIIYSGASLEGLNLKICPVPQRYSSYTRYLDALNANWIRDRGPRFLLWDGGTIDGRHPWAETPATWLEIYRWYDTRLLGNRSLLLERRSAPRFKQLHVIGYRAAQLTSEIPIPRSPEPVFWAIKFDTSATGILRKLLSRVPEVTMRVSSSANMQNSFRVVPEVLISPVLGNALPGNLGEFATLLNPLAVPQPAIQAIRFSGPGISSYQVLSNVEFLQADN
jgi:hypothetical protein